MTQTEMAGIFQRNEHLVKTIATKFAHRYRLPYYEMEEEAFSALTSKITTSWGTYNPRSGTEKIWAYSSIYWGLKTYIRKKMKRNEKFILFTDIKDWIEPTAPQITNPNEKWIDKVFKIFFEVSEEARTLVDIIINTPKEIFEETYSGKMFIARTAIKRYLENVLLWNRKKITKTWKEVQNCLQEA